MTGKEGYILAKREIAKAIENRIIKIDEIRSEALSEMNPEVYTQTTAVIYSLEELRSFIRNFLLWDVRND